MADVRLLLGKLLSDKIKQLPVESSLEDVEFSVYSQFGEDGIIKFITHHLRNNIKHKIFVEIGVENYQIANTRFLLENDGWQGLLIEMDTNEVKQIKESDFYWRNKIFVKEAFINRNNINQIVNDFNLPEEIGLLSLDIDGNDYWVMESIQALKPAIIIVEYNSFFGSDAPISVPYRENFVWQKHHPITYFGASLPAFYYLFEKNGYELIGSTTAGNNAFFVKKEVNRGILKAVSAKDGYRQAIFNSMPCVTPDKFNEQLACLQHQQVVDVSDNTLWRLNGKKITRETLIPEHDITDLLQFNNEELIQKAYQYFLCREVNKDESQFQLKMLHKMKNKHDLLKSIAYSEEGLKVDILVNELVKEASFI